MKVYSSKHHINILLLFCFGIIVLGEGLTQHPPNIQAANSMIAATEEPFLIKEIIPFTGTSYPHNITNVNGTIFFGARTNYASQLWKSDGTANGTVSVKDVSVKSEYPTVVIGSTIYFVGYDGSSYQLWQSDGTEAGTQVLKRINSSGHSIAPGDSFFMASLNGMLYFTAKDGNNSSYKLWQSDGTENGTVLFSNLFPQESIVVNNYLYFTAYSDGHNTVWRTDGTTNSIIEIGNNTSWETYDDAAELTNVGGTIFFRGSSSVVTSLWKIDSLAATMVTGFSLYDFNPTHLTNVDGLLLFSAQSNNETELWKSDGTLGGTVRVKDIFPGTSSSNPANFFSINDILFFTATNSANNIELWRSDGTEANTRTVKEINPTRSAFSPDFDPMMAADGGILYFVADDGVHGAELWRSDGTDAGTYLVKDIQAGPLRSGMIKSPIFINGTLYFAAYDSEYGLELMKSDGTENGTSVILDLETGNGGGVGSGFDYFTRRVGNRLFFTAYNPIYGIELWVSDGTSAGTQFVVDMWPGELGGAYYYQNMTAVNNKLFFTYSEQGLWVTDGTSAGTVNLIESGSFDALAEYNGQLLFSHDNQLWLSDGTIDGTAPFTTASGEKFIYFNDHLYFRNDPQLWRTDGTENGTSLIKNIGGSNSSNYPNNFIVFKDRLFFSATNNLWETDGTQNGTQVVKNLGKSGIKSSIVEANDLLFFIAYVNSSYDLWVSDGTENGTHAINPTQATLANVHSPKAGLDGIFFMADDGVHGEEVWFSDGTNDGTYLVKDIHPTGDAQTEYQTTRIAVNGLFFTSLDDGTHGVELWVSDGTEAGTELVSDLNPGGDAFAYYTSSLQYANETLFIPANDGVRGTELWGLKLGAEIHHMNSEFPKTLQTNDGLLRLNIPTNSLPETSSRLVYRPINATDVTLPDNFGGTALRLTLEDANGNELVNPQFSEPITAVIYYNPDNLPPFMHENTLQPYFYDETSQTWQLIPIVERNIVGNTITVELTHFTNFALFGTVSTNLIYLPLVTR
ncbi:MAG: hypothetical protein GY943_14990 [Chloroflexi bacterium]|nr:hypothetical protein [Chloroflexota bacterium]